jgi:hypothetical protein
MNIKNFFLATVSTLAIAILANPAHAQKFVDIIGNPPYGSDPVNGVLGSGATPNTSSTRPAFINGTQGKVNALGATLTAASISGNQTIGGNSINVDPVAAETVLAVINSPANSNPSARDSLVAALGGGEAAQQLSRSMQGIRSGDGSIDPTILTGAVNSYNSYIRSLIASSQAIQKSTSELDSFVQTLPPGQKAAQVVLGKLLEAAR